MNQLDKIIETTKETVKKSSSFRSISSLEEDFEKYKKRGFIESISKKLSNEETAIIAEIKKASPSKGLIRQNFDPKKIAEDVLIEVHSENELNIALSIDPKLVGINNRDLTTFEVNKDLANELAKNISKDVIVVSESGISSREDILSSKEQGIHTFLIGESFMREPSPGKALREILV